MPSNLLLLATIILWRSVKHTVKQVDFVRGILEINKLLDSSMQFRSHNTNIFSVGGRKRNVQWV